MTSKSGSAEKAWLVEDPSSDEGEMVVVHAQTRGVAKKIGLAELNEHGYTEWTSLRVTRAPEFDGIYGDEMTRAQLAAGWYHGCYTCREHVRSEVVPGEVYDEGHLSAPYVLRHGDVYCSAKCCIKELERKRKELMDKWEAIEKATELWPDIPILDAYKNSHGYVAQLQRPENDYPTTEWAPLETP